MIVHSRAGSFRAEVAARRRGSIVVALVVVLVILQLIVVGVVISGGRDHDLTARRAESIRSFYAAEGAMQVALREVATATDADGNGSIGGVGSFTLGSSVASVTSAENAGITTLTSTSQVGAARRRMQMALRRTTVTSDTTGVAVEAWLLTSTPTTLADVPWSTPANYTSIVPQIYFPEQPSSTLRFMGMPSSRFALRFTAQIQIPSSGLWTFVTNSDEGSELSIDGQVVVSNDGQHGMTTRTGTVTLTSGLHALVVRYFENTGNNGLIVSWQSPSAGAATVIPASAFFTNASTPHLVADRTMYLYADSSADATTVDAYSSAAGPYGGSNVLTSSAVAAINATTGSAWAMSGRATLRGSALVPPGVTPSNVISTWDNSTITGTRTAAASRTTAFVLHPPASMPASSGSITMWAGSWNVSSNIRTAGVTLGGSTTATINGTVIMQIDGDLTIQDDATLTLVGNADVTIFLAGRLNMYANGRCNADSQKASKLKIYMSGSGTDVQITDRSQIAAHIVNPRGRLLLYPQSNVSDIFFGRFAGDGVQTSDKAQVHLDISGGTSSGGATSGTTQIVSWGAVQP